MKPALARRRYLKRIFIVAVGYLATLMGAVTVINRNPEMDTALQVALSLLPVIFVIGMLVAVWQLLADMDEVARHYTERAMAIATFTVLAISGSYGLVDMLVPNIPPMHVFWVFPIFFGVFGIAKILMKDAPC